MYKLFVQEGAHPNGVTDSKTQTPFHGALQPLLLRPLAHAETLSLIREPFQRVGIPVRDEERIYQRIWHATRGNPWLVQFYGEHLFDRASERETQEVRFEDVEEVDSGFELGDFLLTHFLENTLDHGQPVLSERLAALVFAHDETESAWTEGDFVAACRKFDSKLGLDETHTALRNLVNIGLFTFAHDRYSFSLPIIKRKLRSSFPDVGGVFSELRKQETR
jgi:hypothetical protein